MKYFVIANHWDNDRREIVPYIAGEFPTYILAKLFQEAYNNHYNASAVILSEEQLLK